MRCVSIWVDGWVSGWLGGWVTGQMTRCGGGCAANGQPVGRGVVADEVFDVGAWWGINWLMFLGGEGSNVRVWGGVGIKY